MKKGLLSIIGVVSLLMCSNDASAYVKTMKSKSVYTLGGTKSSTAPNQMYISAGFGFAPSVSMGDEDLDSAVALRAALGTSVGAFRFEGELKYTTGAAYDYSEIYFDSYGYTEYVLEVDNSQFAVMLNGYYDINIANNFSAFATAGLGIAFDKTDIAFYINGYDYGTEPVEETLFAYQFGAGISYAITPMITADFMYRYVGTSESGEFGEAISYNELSLIARYKF